MASSEIDCWVPFCLWGMSSPCRPDSGWLFLTLKSLLTACEVSDCAKASMSPVPRSLLLLWATSSGNNSSLSHFWKTTSSPAIMLSSALLSKYGTQLWCWPGWQPPLLRTPQGLTALTSFLSLRTGQTYTAVTLLSAGRGSRTSDWLLPPLRGSWVRGLGGQLVHMHHLTDEESGLGGWQCNLLRFHQCPWSPDSSSPRQVCYWRVLNV